MANNLFIKSVVVLLCLIVDESMTSWSQTLNDDRANSQLNWGNYRYKRNTEQTNQTERSGSTKESTLITLLRVNKPGYCNPSAPPNCIHEKFGICLSDDDYPYDEIKEAIELSELASKYSYKTLDVEDEQSRLTLSKKKEGGCSTVSILIKPIRAANTDGDWRVIIQDASDIIQRERVVTCIEPDSSCKIDRYFNPVYCHNSRCDQQFQVRRLLAYDPCNPQRGVFVDLFRLPSSCTCRLSRVPC